MTEPAAVRVSPERLPHWLADFVEAHGDVTASGSADAVTLTAADGTVATCSVPFPPLTPLAERPYAGLVEHATRRRRVGVLLVRRGGYAAGIFADRQLVASKVGSRHVQGKSKAGGWSQQRFARRREQQARGAFAAAADTAARILAPAAAELDAVVCGGDRAAVDAVLADRRLADLRALVTAAHYPVPDPRRRVLDQMPRHFRAVHITVAEPPPDPAR